MAQESMPPYKPPLAVFFGDLGTVLELPYKFFDKKQSSQKHRETEHRLVLAPSS